MKKILFMVCTALTLAVAPSAKAQFVVTDPANLASGILNSANEIIQTSSTVSNVVKNFKEVEKVYKQGKEYYDKLQAINNLVKDARKVQQTVLLVGDVSEMYVQNFGKMMNGIATLSRRLFYATIFSFSNNISSICLGVLYPRAECALWVL